ncbi:MAG: hypothetical protein ACE5HO_01425 [bacterium]
MMNKKLNSLQDLGEVSQLVNDFKFVKRAYFDLKHEHFALIGKDLEFVDDDYWEDENFGAEVQIFEKRKQLYNEAQELYKALRTKLDK